MYIHVNAYTVVGEEVKNQNKKKQVEAGTPYYIFWCNLQTRLGENN